MTETQVLEWIVAAVGVILSALVGVVWRELQARIRKNDEKCEALAGAVQSLRVDLAVMKERADTHDESMVELRKLIQRIEDKLDRALGIRSPFPKSGE